MTVAQATSRSERVLVCLASGPESALVSEVFEHANLRSQLCPDLERFCREFRDGAGAAVLSEEMLTQSVTQRLFEELKEQPPWSDFPVIIFFNSGGQTPQTSQRMLGILEPLGNVHLLERPIRSMTLLSTIQTALRARRRQYEMRDLLQRLEDAVRYRDQFLALLAHELRNPLSAIRNATLILEQMGLLQGNLAVQQRAVIERQTQQLLHLVDDILDVYRVIANKIALAHNPVDLAEVARRCRDALEPSARALRHQLAFSVATEPIVVEGDALRLNQIITHLLRNAIQYTPPGGKIALTVGTEGNEAVLRVRDNGMGIAEDKMPGLFDQFADPHLGLDRPQGGLGIGLTLVRSLVQMHGGTVTACSAGLKRGSEFTVRLPLRTQPTAIAPASTGEKPRGTRTRRVLIVEDNPDGRETLRLLLQLAGHQVEVAPDGCQGVKKALAWRPDVALVDIGLPGMDGYEVAHQVRAALGSRILLLAMTGYGEPHDRRRALEAGFHAHLVKPVDPEGLQELLVSEPPEAEKRA